MPSAPSPGRPEPSEYAPYYERYISLVSDCQNIVLELMKQEAVIRLVLGGLTEKHSEFRYAPDKWSIREVVGHMIDTERIMAYRALRFARNDATPIEGFEQDNYVSASPFKLCRFAGLLEELGHVRNANICMFRNLTAEAWLRRGVASNHEMSVRALAYVIAGHATHHIKVLVDRYFPAMDLPRASDPNVQCFPTLPS